MEVYNRRRRNRFLCVAVYIQLFSMFLFGCYSFDDLAGEEDEMTLVWIREESGFVSCSVEDGMVSLKYEMCFENKTGYDLTISTFGIALSEDQA